MKRPQNGLQQFHDWHITLYPRFRNQRARNEELLVITTERALIIQLKRRGRAAGRGASPANCPRRPLIRFPRGQCAPDKIKLKFSDEPSIEMRENERKENRIIFALLSPASPLMARRLARLESSDDIGRIDTGQAAQGPCVMSIADTSTNNIFNPIFVEAEVGTIHCIKYPFRAPRRLRLMYSTKIKMLRTSI